MEKLHTKTRENAVVLILISTLTGFIWCEFMYPILSSLTYKVNYATYNNSIQPAAPSYKVDNDYIFPNATEHGDISDVASHHPKYQEWPRLCLPTTKKIKCLFRSCIRVSVVGLCTEDREDGLRRELPTRFRCPKLSWFSGVILQHADNPESIAESDIVLFTSLSGQIDTESWRRLHQFRSSGQMWVFQTGMSPLDEAGPLPPWLLHENTFNVSNTYRTNADIFSPYGYYQPHRIEESHDMVNVSEIHSNKSRFMVWVNRDCERLHWNRTAFVRDLQKVMDVDIFNECGNNTRPLCQGRLYTDCIKEVDKPISSYKFYLAIESSCCDDYLTESFWHAFSIGTIPIVMGPRIENYKKLAPPNSFIHMDQFDSVEHLNEYLQYLNENSTAYLEFFQWRLEGSVREHSLDKHYMDHLSNHVMCSIVDQYLVRQDSPAIRGRMFDPYGPEWKGTCHKCGEHQWIRSYEWISHLVS